MLRFGIFSVEEYRPIPAGASLIVRALTNKRISLQLLRTDVHASPAEIVVFESATLDLRLGGRIYRTSYRGRFTGLDPVLNALLSERYGPDSAIEVHDWAASDGLASSEWATSLFRIFPRATLIASDQTLFLVEVTLPDGAVFIVEANGRGLQYVQRPFVVRLDPPEPKVFLVNWMIGRKALARLATLQLLIPASWLESEEDLLSTPSSTLRKIPLTHPEARMLEATEARFSMRCHSAFERLDRPVEVIRTMNLLNRGYFSPERLQEGACAVWHSLRVGGCWIVGRTLKDGRLNASVFERTDTGYRPITRIGEGSEIEELALHAL